MHALITADTLGGVWTYTRELVSGLVRQGVRVTLVSFGNIPSPTQTSWMEDLDGLDYRPTAFKLEWMQECEDDIRASTEYLQAVVEETKPDVLHLNQYCYGALPTDVPRLVVAHSDVVSWWGEVHGHEPPDNDWIVWYRDAVACGLASAAAVAAPSQWMLDRIIVQYGAHPNSRIIHNGRNPHLFNPYVEKENCVLAAGRLWDAGKNVDLLTKAQHSLPVRIVGSTSHPDRPRAGAKRQQARGNVTFDGFKSEGEMRELYSRSAIYAVTSRYEPFGLAPLEAAFSRCALVVNDIPSMREIWGEAACYFRTNDADDLAEAIQSLSVERDKRVHYGNLAYQRARQLYTADRMVKGYMQLYSELVRAEVAAA